METCIDDQINETYQVGLNKEKEAVISAHFMHSINNAKMSLYSAQLFQEKSIIISMDSLLYHLIPAIISASDHFIQQRAAAARLRAKENYKQYGLTSTKQIDLPELFTEVLFDRQFLKGSKSHFSRLLLRDTFKRLLLAGEPIKMVIPALPYKSFSPLKSRGILPDLSELHFLFSLMEIVKTIDLLYSDNKQIYKSNNVAFSVVCDGRRFNKFLNEPDECIDNYQQALRWWIKKLNLSNLIELIDYRDLITSHLSPYLKELKKQMREQERQRYASIMMPIFNPDHMEATISTAIHLDPDPERSHTQGRFVPLFNSLIYIIRYNLLLAYQQLFNHEYEPLYIMLTRHLFNSFVTLIDKDYFKIKAMILSQDKNVALLFSQEKINECLRRSMLTEVWNATIEYIAEIKSDRNLPSDPISTCLPNHIRWTIHAKPGQIAILTTTMSGDPVQPWHGTGVFKMSKQKKIKLYTLPILALEGVEAIPIVVDNDYQELAPNQVTNKAQPFFYVHPNLQFEKIDDFFKIIKTSLTRKRKF